MNESAFDSDKLQYILDRIEIEDCLTRYCHAVDRCNADLLREVYWPDATDDHIFWKGNAGDFVDYCIPILRSRDQTLHAISNILIRIDGDDARSQCYFNAYERLRNKESKPNDITMHGRYLDRFEKRNGEWRIAERKVVLDWWRVWEDSADWARGLFGTKNIEVGKRGQDDPSAALFGDRLFRQKL